MSATPRLYPRTPAIPTYWWDGHPNFGDGLTPWLLPRYGIAPILRSPSTAELVGVGSILEHVPSDFAGMVWGTGLIFDRPRALPHASFLALRGDLTRQHVGAPVETPLGDPGLLVSQHIPRPRTRWTLGVVPHGHHRHDPDVMGWSSRYPADVRVINVHQETGRVVREIAACDAIITTSLHGLVTADAFGIKAAWTTREPALIGGVFKFRDYESVVSPGRSRYFAYESGASLTKILAQTTLVEPCGVAASVAGLESSIADLRSRLQAGAQSPLKLWRHLLDGHRHAKRAES